MRISDWSSDVCSSDLLLPMLWFALHFRHLRLPGRLFFCALIQANVAVLTWSVSLPLDFYLDPFDWAMLGLLLPAQVEIVAIMLINGFEFTEALWQRGGRMEGRRVGQEGGNQCRYRWAASH